MMTPYISDFLHVMNTSPVTTTAIVPIAGLGSRMLPLAHIIPKELFPVGRRPSIDYVVRDLVAGGITKVIFVVGVDGSITPDYFQPSSDYLQQLRSTGKEQYAQLLEEMADCIEVVLAVQDQPLGDGHAVLQAQPYVDENHVMVGFGDDLVFNPICSTAQMQQAFDPSKMRTLIGVQHVALEKVSDFGIIDPTESESPLTRVSRLVEKPPQHEAPSQLAIIGKYLLSTEIFADLARIQGSGEIRLIEAMSSQIQTQSVFALKIQGQRFDVGQYSGWVAANRFVQDPINSHYAPESTWDQVA